VRVRYFRDGVAAELARTLDFFKVRAREKGEVLGAFAAEDLGRVRLEVALADHELVQEPWLASARCIALVGKDFECDEMPSMITH
jgi:hypothetical protein